MKAELSALVNVVGRACGFPTLLLMGLTAACAPQGAHQSDVVDSGGAAIDTSVTRSDASIETADPPTTCAASCTPESLAGDRMEAHAIAKDGNNLYWSCLGEYITYLMRTDLNSLETEPVAGTANISSITIDASYIYTNSYGSDDTGEGVFRVSKLDGNNESLNGTDGVFTLLNDATDLYYNSDDGVVRLSKAGGEPEILTTDAYGAYLALDDTHVYISSATSVRKVPKAGGDDVVLATTTAPDYPYAIAVDEQYVYWASSQSVSRVSKDGGDVETLAAITGLAEAIALDDAWVYWGDGPRVMRVAKTGGNAEVVADGQIQVAGLIVDHDYIYWTDIGNWPDVAGKVMRLSRCACHL